MKYLAMVALLSLTMIGVRAQEVCGTDILHQRLVKENPQIQEHMEAWEAKALEMIESGQASRQNGKYIIPTVVHVMWYNCEGNISRSQVQSGIDVLNDAMNLRSPDTVNVREVFRDHMGSLDIEFRLARFDENGNPTDGINRRSTSMALSANDNVKNIENWGNSQRSYFQIWVVENISIGAGGQVNGYAYFPGSVSWHNWGVVIRHDKFGNTGTSTTDGSTLSHEVGHNLNLFHTFQDGCGGGCSTTGDRCCDTPPAAYPDWSCSSATNTCSNDAGSGSPYDFGTEDMMENIMSYSSCRYIFTEDQVDRMTNLGLELHSHIENLYSQDNLLATGVTGFQEANFSTESPIVVADQPMVFQDATRYESDGWSWDFGASSFPPASTEQNPEVTIIETGLVPINFTAFNQGDSMKIQKEVFVVSERGTPTPMRESFETTEELPADAWIAMDHDGDGFTWMPTDQAAFDGDRSLMIENYGLCGSTSDELVSTSLDMEPFGQATLEFKVAFARTSTDNNDIFRVWMSNDFGKTWDLAWAVGGSTLASVNDLKVSSWAPQDSTEWEAYSVNFGGNFREEGVMFKMEFVGDGGNNLYLDDVHVSGSYLNKVFLSSPENGGQGLPNDLTIDWKAVGGVDSYEYQLDTEPSFDTPSLITGTTDYINESPENEDTEVLLEDMDLDQKYYWRVRGKVGGVNTEWSDVWNFSISGNGVGMNELSEQASLLIYPNPAQDRLTIVSSKELSSIRLIDLRGRIVSSLEVTSGKLMNAMDVSAVLAGAYLIEAIDREGRRSVERLIIQ